MEINLDALQHNAKQIRRRIGDKVRLLAVVKAEAYGHGAEVIAQELEPLVDYFGVATVEEGLRLRKSGVKKPITVFGGFYPGEEDLLLRGNLEPAVFTLQQMRDLSLLAHRSGKKVPVHLKIDTGLGRLGFPWDRLGKLKDTMDFKGLEVKSAFTTLASAAGGGNPSVELQRKRFDKAIYELNGKFDFEFLHIANSAALLAGEQNYYSMVRPGLLFYGISPFGDEISDFLPVMRYVTEVIYLKEVPSGTPLGYNGTFITKRRSLIATVPAGYDDGVPRVLSNRGFMIIKGRKAPIVGAVSMDLTLLDVTDIDGVKVGDEVVFFSNSSHIWEISRLSNTIPYEILCRIGRRVTRVYIKGGKVLERREL